MTRITNCRDERCAAGDGDGAGLDTTAIVGALGAATGGADATGGAVIAGGGGIEDGTDDD